MGQAFTQAGSNPAATRSEHRVHLYTFPVVGLMRGTSKGHPVTQNWQPMQFSWTKSTIPLAYCTMAPGAGQARRHPGSSQCMHWNLVRVQTSRSSRCTSLNLMSCQKLYCRSGNVW